MTEQATPSPFTVEFANPALSAVPLRATLWLGPPPEPPPLPEPLRRDRAKKKQTWARRTRAAIASDLSGMREAWEQTRRGPGAGSGGWSNETRTLCRG